MLPHFSRGRYVLEFISQAQSFAVQNDYAAETVAAGLG